MTFLLTKTKSWTCHSPETVNQINQSELEAVLANGKLRNTNTLVSIPLLIGQENGGKDFNNA